MAGFDRGLAPVPADPGDGGKIGPCILPTRSPPKTSPSNATATREHLSALWPGGWQPTDRLGVLLANPMDAVGCSNLICGTITLFYDQLRVTRGTGNFFRYSDVFLFGVGCEPGDFNQLDVWPLHKFVSILQPSAEAVIEAVNDRRITLSGRARDGRPLPWRGRALDLEHVPRPGAGRAALLVAHRPRPRRRRDRSSGNKVVESYVEQAIFSTPGLDAGYQARLRRLRRNIDREEKQSVESYRTIAGPAQLRGLVGVTQVLPPGHQELTRRATPTVIMPVEVPMPPIEASFAPFDIGAAATLGLSEPAPPAPSTEGLLKTAFDRVERRLGGTFAEWEGWDWISDFGDPVAEHHAVRESVGIWDESPLRKWFFKGPDALRAADRIFTADMAALEVGQCRYGPFCDEQGRMLGDGVVYRGQTDDDVLVVTALDTDVDHFRRVTGDLDMEITEHTFDMPHLQVQGPRSRELLAGLTDADIASLRYFRFFPHPITVAGVEGCWVSRTGLLGRARLRGVLPAGRGGRAGLAGPARRGRRHRHPPVRARRRRVAAHRGRPDLPRLRLLPGRHEPVPHEPRAHDQAREARVRRPRRPRCASTRPASPTGWSRS